MLLLSVVVALAVHGTPVPAASSPPAPVQGATIAIKVEHIVKPDGTLGPGGWIVVKGGRLESVGGADAPAGASQLDFPHGVAAPGFIDPVTALGATGDLAETARAFTPEVQAGDAFDADHSDFRKAAAGGITTVGLSPSSSNVVGGHVAIVRTSGEQGLAVLSGSGPLRFALTPAAFDFERAPTSRMGALPQLREMLAGDKLKAAGPCLVDASSPDEIRIALETFQAAGRQVALLRPNGAIDPDRRRRRPLQGEQRARGGRPLLALGVDADARAAADAFIAAASRSPSPRAGIPAALRLTAALAVRGGLPADKALQALTAVPARVLGLDDCGSLEAGKRADLARLRRRSARPRLAAPARAGRRRPAGQEEPLIHRAEQGDAMIAPLYIITSLLAVGSAGDTGPAAFAQRLKTESIVVQAGEVRVGDGTVFKPGVVVLLDGRIVAVGQAPPLPSGSRTIDCSKQIVTTGLVDAACQLGTCQRFGFAEQSSEVIPRARRGRLDRLLLEGLRGARPRRRHDRLRDRRVVERHLEPRCRGEDRRSDRRAQARRDAVREGDAQRRIVAARHLQLAALPRRRPHLQRAPADDAHGLGVGLPRGVPRRHQVQGDGQDDRRPGADEGAPRRDGGQGQAALPGARGDRHPQRAARLRRVRPLLRPRVRQRGRRMPRPHHVAQDPGDLRTGPRRRFAGDELRLAGHRVADAEAPGRAGGDLLPDRGRRERRRRTRAARPASRSATASTAPARCAPSPATRPR